MSEEKEQYYNSTSENKEEEHIKEIEREVKSDKFSVQEKNKRSK